MNPTEQKKHTTVTMMQAQRLNKIAENLAREISAREDEDQAITARLNREQQAGLKTAGEQRAYVDRGDKLTDGKVDRFIGRGFWSRLNWLITGR